MKNLVWKQGKWQGLKKLKMRAWPLGIGGERGGGGGGMELSVDDIC